MADIIEKMACRIRDWEYETSQQLDSIGCSQQCVAAWREAELEFAAELYRLVLDEALKGGMKRIQEQQIRDAIAAIQPDRCQYDYEAVSDAQLAADALYMLAVKEHYKILEDLILHIFTLNTNYQDTDLGNEFFRRDVISLVSETKSKLQQQTHKEETHEKNC